MKEFFTKTRVMHLISLVLNLVTTALVIYAMTAFFIPGRITSNNTNMAVLGKYCFRYFTNLSNMYCGITCLIVAVFNIKTLISGKDEEPKWAAILKFTGTVAVTVTFLVVMFFLGPTQGYDIMLNGPCLYLHLLCPLLAIISYCCTELKTKLKFVETLYGVITVILYAIVYLIMVLITEYWPDFYGFKTIIPWYVSIVVMPIAGWLFSLAVNYLQVGIRKLIKPEYEDHIEESKVIEENGTNQE